MKYKAKTYGLFLAIFITVIPIPLVPAPLGIASIFECFQFLTHVVSPYGWPAIILINIATMYLFWMVCSGICDLFMTWTRQPED
jgi:hypothetical protein